MAELLQQNAISATQEAIQEMIRTVKELPEETIRWVPELEEWSIMQIIAHVAEAIPFWLKEIEQVIGDPESTWGRDHTHAGRLEAVSEEQIKTLTVDQVLANLEKIPAQVEETVGPLSNDQLAIVAPSRNLNFDGKPLQFVVDNLIVKHIEGHNGQIKRNLSKL